MNNTYKYQLDQTSKKFQCPQCHKKTLVRYIETDSKQYLENHIGRCDRESKCSYNFSPKGNQPILRLPENFKPVLPSYHHDNVIGYYGKNYMQNNFISYLLKFFASVDVKNVIQYYFIGTANHWRGDTLFWQVDENMKVQAGKVMLYDKERGNRVKKPYSHIHWMHRVLQIDDFVLQQCLFGLHNLNDCTLKTIALVESEKTAIIMHILRPDMIWMATGSKTNLKLAFLKSLKGRKIMAFPDKTEFQDWIKRVNHLRKDGFNIICSNLLEHTNLEDGDDLVDFILNKKVA